MKRKLKPEFFIHFMGEIPSFRDGRRGVTVKKIGTKWVYLICTCTGDTAKINVALWRSLPKHVVKRNKMTGEIVF